MFILLTDFIKESTAILLPASCYVCGRRLWHRQICHRCLPSFEITSEARCPICFSLTGNNEICIACKSMPLPFNKTRFIWNYYGQAKDLVKIMKYRPSPALCKIAGNFLVEAYPLLNFNENFDLIVTIPSSKKNLRLRGFNQCDVLAKCLAKSLSIPFQKRGLKHIKSIKSQASLSHYERLSNVNNVFYADRKICLNKNILLIDDVVTTGATSQSAAITLLKSGAKSVSLLSLIRSDTWNGFRGELYKKFKNKQKEILSKKNDLSF